MSPAELSKAILKPVYWAATKVPTCLFGDHQRLLVQGADKDSRLRIKVTYLEVRIQGLGAAQTSR